jgi:lysophospholipase L1-like esterase
MDHIVLLGDSVFDNKAYVGPKPDVSTHLGRIVPDGWKVTLRAIDGSLVQDVAEQLSMIPSDASHLFLSAGGNDALMNADVLNMPVSSSAEFLNALSKRIAQFEERYIEMLSGVFARKLPVAVSTIYYPNFADRQLQRIAISALSSFNDVIIRQAAVSKIPILDLRLICSEPDDYANEIEPSGKGGEKIAVAIKRLLDLHGFSRPMSAIYY